MTIAQQMTPEWAREAPGHWTTFEHVWVNWRHVGQNPFREDTEEFTRWRDTQAEAERLRKRKWIDRFPRLEVQPRERSKRRLEQPVLKLPFDTIDDIRLRLDRSYIFIGSDLYYVREINHDNKEFYLLVNGKDGNDYICPYSSPHIDLRTPEPQYIQYGTTPVFLTRVTSRSQRQGLNSENSVGWGVYPKQTLRVTDNAKMLTESISFSSSTLSWNPTYAVLLGKNVPALRLSKNLAVYFDGENICVDYRNRKLGTIQRDTVYISERDLRRPWIMNDLSAVGLTAEQQK